MIGTAFGVLVTALVRDLITPLIAAIGGKPDFSDLAFEINGSQFLYGDFINALLTFLIIAAVVFFLVIKPVNALMDKFKSEPSLDEQTRKCPECLSEIPVPARRCSFCTAEVGLRADAPAPTASANPALTRVPDAEKQRGRPLDRPSEALPCWVPRAGDRRLPAAPRSVLVRAHRRFRVCRSSTSGR